MAKFFKTVEGCFNYIKKNESTGKEKEVNGVLMFGMGLYIYSDVATWLRVKNCSGTNSVFYYFANDAEIRKTLSALLQRDGYLEVNN